MSKRPYASREIAAVAAPNESGHTESVSNYQKGGDHMSSELRAGTAHQTGIFFAREKFLEGGS